ncbi:MAG TPA: phenylalanine--tRNA ligase subunit alpha [Solirubrobacteraceae bacterium]|nr:phenylalanine--tRNA ligase subunit alpha [Solirubrobacteraceae bacterium]
MTERIAQLRAEADAAIAAASTSAELEELRVRYLGRKAELPNILRGIATLAPEERGPTGKAANQARQALDANLAQRAEQLAGGELEEQLRRDVVDVTLPGTPPQSTGHLHLLTATRREIEDVFLGLGFKIAEGPEVETVYYNFDALNHAPTHPARDRQDTFYVDRPEGDVVLRTHTSPMQIRALEAQPPPLYIISPGRVYRRDSDATHTPQFHQIEGLAVDTDITLTDLKGTLLAFARAIFGPDREVRLRPHFFPFTEPSVEVDVSCFMEHEAGGRCRVCKNTGWVEILGSGMVDPNVFSYVSEYGYDAEKVQGFAFGMGIERIAMLKHGVPDLRLLYDNDRRFLEQFG